MLMNDSVKFRWILPIIIELEGCPETCRAPMTLTFEVPEWNPQMALLPVEENNLLCHNILKSIHMYWISGRTDGQTHAWTYAPKHTKVT